MKSGLMTVTHKSEEMQILAEENGWKTKIEINLEKFEHTGNLEDMVWTLYAMRGEKKIETIKVVWTGNLQTECAYKYGDYILRPVRKAPVVALLKGTPNPDKYCKNKNSGPVSYEDATRNRELPFDNDSPAFDILVAVANKNVSWMRPGSEIVHTENVPNKSNLGKAHFRVKTTKAGKRVLEWANSTGFCACYVEDIISVG